MPVGRIFLSEATRMGVGTYAPHDPTTADLVGSVCREVPGSRFLSRGKEFTTAGEGRLGLGVVSPKAAQQLLKNYLDEVGVPRRSFRCRVPECQDRGLEGTVTS